MHEVRYTKGNSLSSSLKTYIFTVLIIDVKITLNLRSYFNIFLGNFRLLSATSDSTIKSFESIHEGIDLNKTLCIPVQKYME